MIEISFSSPVVKKIRVIRAITHILFKISKGENNLAKCMEKEGGRESSRKFLAKELR
jgi:hypothetical protein